MNQVKEDPEREERITMEAIVDCYDSEEQVMGWYYYLADKIVFPFEARCEEERSISPLQTGEIITVLDIADTDDCRCEMLVTIEWNDRSMAVPLAQLVPVEADDDTEEAISDWRYWVGRGYQLC